MRERKTAASRSETLSVERLEPRLLLAPINPGQSAVLQDGDQLFFVQGESDEEDVPPSDFGGEPQEDWVIIATYQGPGTAVFTDSSGDPTVFDLTEDFGSKINSIQLNGTTEESNLFIQVGEFGEDFSLDDVTGDPPTLPLSSVVQLVTNDAGQYVWGSGGDPAWMDTIPVVGGDPVNVPAPEGSGAAVVTGNVTFDESSTGFGTFAIDGALKGQIMGLDRGETLHEVRTGYIHNPQTDFVNGSTVGGIDIEGNVDRLFARTTIGELEDENVNLDGLGDLLPPAEIDVGGHLIELQASGSIFANINVEGRSVSSPVFDFDRHASTGEDLGPGAASRELLTGDGLAGGYINDSPDLGFIVGSPTGDFTVEGSLFFTTLAISPPFDKDDPQDWYLFNAEQGEEVTIEMTSDFPEFRTHVFGPSGRLVTVVPNDGEASFVATEAGAYSVMVGEPEDFQRGVLPVSASSNYVLEFTGTKPVALGGVRSTSAVFGAPVADSELGDDGAFSSISGGSIGMLVAADTGVLGLPTISTDDPDGEWPARSGDIGLITMPTNDTGVATAFTLDAGGDVGRLAARDDVLLFGQIVVGGSVGEIQSAGSFGFDTGAGLVSVGEGVGSAVVQGDFNAVMNVGQGGVDLLYVGGDFGSVVALSELNTVRGGDVGFVFVGGTILDNGDEVMPVDVAPGQTQSFTDDGGSVLRLTPMRSFSLPEGVPGTLLESGLTYRFLPVGEAVQSGDGSLVSSGGAVGAALASLDVVDSLKIEVVSGRADVGFVNLEPVVGSPIAQALAQNRRFLRVAGGEPLAELDVYRVDAAGQILGGIVNNSHRGDILNVEAASVNRIFARGSVGVTERKFSPGGQLLNPLPSSFLPPDIAYVSRDPSLETATSTAEAAPTVRSDQFGRYFNGVVVSGFVNDIRANNSIGNVFVGGRIGLVRADADRAGTGPAFNMHGFGYAAGEFDGIAGMVFSSLGFNRVDPGDGVHDLFGGRPAAGVMTDGNIDAFNATDATISAPIFAQAGIGRMILRNSNLDEAIVGAGAEFSDSTFWDEPQTSGTTDGVRLGALRITGGNGGINRSIIQVGVLGNLFLGPNTAGMVDSDILALGDSTTGRGIGSITVLSGVMDGTDSPPFFDRAENIFSNQRIGNIRLTGAGAEMRNMDIRSLKSINSIFTTGDVTTTQRTEVTAALGIRSIQGRNFGGEGELRIGASDIGRIVATRNLDSDLSVDGPIRLVSVGQTLNGSIDLLGPAGRVERVIVGNGVNGRIAAGGGIGTVDVRNGDMSGQIVSGGSTPDDVAIGRVFVRNGDMDGSIRTEAGGDSNRPGGGIGTVIINGSLDGDVVATSHFDPATGIRVSADIGLIRITGGDLDGNVRIQRSGMNDPGGALNALLLSGGSLFGDVTVEGNVGRLIVNGGVISAPDTDTIDVEGDMDLLIVNAPAGTVVALSSTVLVGGDLGVMRVSGGDVVAPVSVGERLGTLILASNADLLGPVSAGELGVAVLNSPAGLAADFTVAGDAQRVIAPAGVTSGAADLVVGGNLGFFLARDDVVGDITVGDPDARTGNVTTIAIIGMLEGELTVGGDVNLLRIVNPGMDAVTGQVTLGDTTNTMVVLGDVKGDVTIGNGDLGDRVAQFVLRGDLDAEFQANGDVGAMSLIGGQVTSNGDSGDARIEVTGDVGLMRTLGSGAVATVVDDEISVGDALGTFVVSGGSFDGTLQAGTAGTLRYLTPDGVQGAISSDEDIDALIVSPGGINADVSAARDIGRIFSAGDVNGSTIDAGRNLGRITVGGGMELSEVTAGGGIAAASVARGFVDTDIDAGTLGRVSIGRQIASPNPPDNVIHADSGSFTLFAAGARFDITSTNDQTFDGGRVRAFVG